MKREMQVRPAFPLRWPAGVPRTPAAARRRSQFKVNFQGAWNGFLDELERMGASDVTPSSMVPLGAKGIPVAKVGNGPLGDPGVAVHFTLGGVSRCIACDGYDEVRANLRALGVTVRALREIGRHGATRLMEQAMVGFTALPARSERVPTPGAQWPEVADALARSAPEVIDAEVVEAPVQRRLAGAA